MGFYSWKTSDTGKSIANVHSTRLAFTVYAHLPDGTNLMEDGYGGYGVFGGRDYYGLVVEINGLAAPVEGMELEEFDELWRDLGISLCYSPTREEIEALADRYSNREVYADMKEKILQLGELKKPRLAESCEVHWRDLPDSIDCPEQGFFYDDE